MHSLSDVQRYLADQGIDAWLLYDFRGSNPVFTRLCPQKKWTTRRVWLHIPAAGRGEPLLLHSGIDGPSFREVDLPKRSYLGWRDMTEALSGLLGPGARIAMDYSPGNALPVVSCVDAGAVELIRGLGAEVVSSANVAQVAVAAWSSAAVEAHGKASCAVAGIKDAAFGLIRQRVGAGQRVLEHEVADFIREGFKREGLQWPDGPIVGVNAHSGDPHYEPGADRPTEIKRGDWVLIDLWARRPGDEHIYSDITWCGYVGGKGQCPADRLRVFETVRAARDAALEAARAGWKRPGGVQGWELDEAARGVIIGAGFAEGIRHRTGHSLSPGQLVHGLGMNLDNLETRDTRRMLPGTGFTIEPGIYLPQFGVRMEINVYVDAAKGPVVTSCVQEEPVWLG